MKITIPGWSIMANNSRIITSTYFLDPRVQIFGSCAFLMIVVSIKNPLILGLIFLFVLILWKVNRIPIKNILSMIKLGLYLIGMLIVLSTLYSYFFPQDMQFIPFFLGVGIYYEIFIVFLMLTLRFFILISYMILLSFTTTPSRMLSALRALKIPYELAIMATITLRFIPLSLEIWKKLEIVAQIRGIETKGFKGRLYAIKNLSFPLLIQTIKRAKELAYSLDSRAFRSINKPVNLIPLKFHKLDYFVVFISIGLFAVSIASYLGISLLGLLT